VPHLHALWSEASKKGIRKRKTGRTYAGKRARAGRRHVTLVHPSFLLTSLTNASLSPLPHFVHSNVGRRVLTVPNDPICGDDADKCGSLSLLRPLRFHAILWPD